MSKTLKSKAVYCFKIALSLAPWIIAMYLFYWLDSRGVWTPDTPHRGKLSVALLGAGMLFSFLAFSVLLRGRR